jgi:hypothetical protein
MCSVNRNASFQTLSAFRHADSWAKFICALQPAVHRLPWSRDLWTQYPSCIWSVANCRFSVIVWKYIESTWVCWAKNVHGSEWDDLFKYL